MRDSSGVPRSNTIGPDGSGASGGSGRSAGGLWAASPGADDAGSDDGLDDGADPGFESSVSNTNE